MDKQRGIVFDCFGVLYHGSLTHLVELAPEDKRPDVTELNHHADLGYVTRDDYIGGMADLTGLSYDEVAEIIRHDHVRNAAMVDLVRWTRERGAKTGLLSNIGQHTMERLFSTHEQKTLFDAVVLSSDEHIAKPDPRIFTLMASRLGLPEEDCLMIDDIESNVVGAESAGMSGVQHIHYADTKRAIEEFLGA